MPSTAEAPGPPVTCLLVIRQDRPEVYAAVRERYRHDARVQVVRDRRETERRVQAAAGRLDQRRQPRRRPRTLTPFGFVIVQKPGAEPIPVATLSSLEATLSRLLGRERDG